MVVLDSALNDVEINAINLGPLEVGISVQDIVNIFMAHPLVGKLKGIQPRVQHIDALEAKNLVLDSRKAIELLGIHPRFTSKQAINITFDWWERVIAQIIEPHGACIDDIKLYLGENLYE